jgi:hypothetical protein
MRPGGSLCVWLALAGCSSASEATPPAHDVIDVAVAPPTATAALTAQSDLVSRSSAAAVASSTSTAMAMFEDAQLSAALRRVPSSAVMGSSGPTKTGNAVVTLLANAGGKIDNAGPVVAGMAAGFRRCYRRGLANAPASAGRVQILTRVGPNGEVMSTAPQATGSLDGSVVSCVASRVSSAQFAKPSRTPATLTISVTLTPN